MKKTTKFSNICLLLIASFLMLTSVVSAQREPKSVRDDNRVIKAMTKRVDKIGWLYYKEKTKLTYQSLINDNKDAFGLTSNDLVKVDKEESDAIGGKHQRLKQYYKGIEVENVSYVLHFDKKGHLTHSNGELGEEIDANTSVEPKISEAEALEKAVSALDGLKPAWTNPMLEQNLRRIKEDSSATYKPKGKLLLVSADNGKYKLAYTFGITTSEPMKDWQVSVDARNKQILKRVLNSDQCYDLPAYCTPVGIGLTSLYNGNQSAWGKKAGFFSSYAHLKTCNNDIHSETVDHNGSSLYNIIQDGGAGWGIHHQQFTSAHWAVQSSWNYFQNTFGRYGWDNNFEDAVTFVNQTGTYENIAGFSRNNQRILVDKSIMSLDIMAHEYTHGVADNSVSNLNGFGEAGALNESFADIFGSLTNRYVTGNMVWSVGTQVPWVQLGFSSPIVRNFINPSSSTPPNAAIFQGTNWVNPINGPDRGGIHTNCGVQNRWFNLLAQGGNQNGVTVQGIGIDNAAKIAYYNMTTQLFSAATFQNAANGAVAIAESFYGCASNELEQTRRAWQAVGLNTPQPQLSINGGGDVCSEYYDTQVTLEGCWRFGTNYWWTVPSQFTSWTSGTGNNTLTITVPAHYQGAINLSVYAAVNGFAPQNVPITINAFDCGGPAIIGSSNTNQSLKKQFILSPNPTSGVVNLSLPREFINAILDAEIYNSLGQKVYGKRISGNDTQLEMSELPKGIYNVLLKNLSNKEIIFSSKLTKM